MLVILHEIFPRTLDFLGPCFKLSFVKLVNILLNFFKDSREGKKKKRKTLNLPPIYLIS